MTTKEAVKHVDQILLDGKFIHYGFALTNWTKGDLEEQADAHNPIAVITYFDEENFEELIPAVAAIAKHSGMNVAIVGTDKRPSCYQCGRLFTDATIIDCFPIN